MIELNKIYNEDCLEGMKRIPDGSVSSSSPVGKTAKAHASSPSPPTCSASIDCHMERKTNWRRR